MKTLKLVLTIMLLSHIASAASVIMSLSEIRPGMKGIGKTVFKGTDIETFEFEVLGIQENALGPHKSLIWAELKNPILSETGVMAGMSGSPLYIDGKIIGAVAYGVPFAKKAIAGITPIQDMLTSSNFNSPTISVEISNINVNLDQKSIRPLTESLTKTLVQRLSGLTSATITPIELVASSNRSPTDLKQLLPLMSYGQIKPNLSPKSAQAETFQLREADAVAIPLIRGDYEYNVSGTVTYVDGKNVYMFGHPFYNLGTVNFPMHKAEVITPFPSYNNSFKMHATLQQVGTVKQDRLSSVYGVLGEEPVMMPMKIFLKNHNRTINLEIISHPLLNPTLTGLALLSTFSSEYQDYGFQSLRVNGHIFIEGEKNIEIDDFYSGISAYNEFSNLMIAIQFILLNNKEKPALIQKIDFELEGQEALRLSSIEDVIVNKRSFASGEPINLHITMQNERGPKATEQFTIEAPNLPDNSTFFLFVGGKEEMIDFESKNLKTNFFPGDLNSIIRAVNNLRKNNRIYVKLVSPISGLFVNGYEYSQLPNGIQSIFSYNDNENVPKNDVKMSTLAEYQIEIPNVVSGLKVFKLTTKER